VHDLLSNRGGRLIRFVVDLTVSPFLAVVGPGCLSSFSDRRGENKNSMQPESRFWGICKGVTRTIPEGIARGTHAFQVLAARSRWSQRPEPTHDSDFDNLARAWDARVLRHGDQVSRSGGSVASAPGIRTHANTFTVEGLVRQGFLQVGERFGKSGVASGVDETRRGLECMLSVAGVGSQMFEHAEQNLINSCRSGASAVVLQRHHDGTPIVLKYSAACGPPTCMCLHIFRSSYSVGPHRHLPAPASCDDTTAWRLCI
jgi:hypothetical protein